MLLRERENVDSISILYLGLYCRSFSLLLICNTHSGICLHVLLACFLDNKAGVCGDLHTTSELVNVYRLRVCSRSMAILCSVCSKLCQILLVYIFKCVFSVKSCYEKIFVHLTPVSRGGGGLEM